MESGPSCLSLKKYKKTLTVPPRAPRPPQIVRVRTIFPASLLAVSSKTYPHAVNKFVQIRACFVLFVMV